MPFVIASCEMCGKSFTGRKRLEKNPRFCCMACAGKYRTMKAAKTCPGCGKEFTQQDARNTKCCSMKCWLATRDSKKHPLYSTWRGMRQRCKDSNAKSYPDYGGRGISVCKEWNESFAAFAGYIDRVLGHRPKGYTLDRIDNDGNYEPGNVRWASRAMQSQNQRRFLPPVSAHYTPLPRKRYVKQREPHDPTP